MSDPRIDYYDWSGGREAMLRFGPDSGPVAMLALPLFEEANRTRAFGVSILHALAARGIGGVLPDLPGQGESEIPTQHARLSDLRSAYAVAPGTHALSIRSGALLIDERPCWLLAPQDGAGLMRELTRVKGSALEGDVVEVAGNLLSRSLLHDLQGAVHPGLRQGGCRTVRLASDASAADRHVAGPALWRRAEPDNDPALVEQLAADIAEWIATCGG